MEGVGGVITIVSSGAISNALFGTNGGGFRKGSRSRNGRFEGARALSLEIQSVIILGGDAKGKEEGAEQERTLSLNGQGLRHRIAAKSSAEKRTSWGCYHAIFSGSGLL